MPPEVPIRHLPVENQGAARDGAFKRWWSGIGSHVVKSFRERGGGCMVLRDRIFISGGGGTAGGQVESRHAFMGILRHGYRVGYRAALNQKWPAHPRRREGWS